MIRKCLISTFYFDAFKFHRTNNESSFKVRVTGDVSELSETDIAEFYKQEPLHAKIRSKICRCGEAVDWNELKTKHDHVLKNYQDGVDALPQTDT